MTACTPDNSTLQMFVKPAWVRTAIEATYNCKLSRLNFYRYLKNADVRRVRVAGRIYLPAAIARSLIVNFQPRWPPQKIVEKKT